MSLRFAVALLLLVGSVRSMASSKSRREHGAQIYAANGCQHCHTIAAVGGHKGPDLSGIGRIANKETIRKQIVFGGKMMPEFGDMLSQPYLDDLVTYLRLCKAKVVPPTRPSAQAFALSGANHP